MHPLSVGAFRLGLEDLSVRDLNMACRKVLLTSKFMPVVATIREALAICVQEEKLVAPRSEYLLPPRGPLSDAELAEHQRELDAAREKIFAANPLGKAVAKSAAKESPEARRELLQRQKKEILARYAK